jgi:hypothetical protein
MKLTLRCVLFCGIIFAAMRIAGAADVRVMVTRVPDGGVQPQAAVDSKGRVHLIYCTGDPAHGDVFYVVTTDGEKFSQPIRVNSQPGSVIAIGTVRGPQLAIGKDDRVHVAWMGSSVAEPKVMGHETPMLYTHLNAAGDAFELQRNVIHDHPGLDGGGSIAADRAGNVYVGWHAPMTMRMADAKTGGMMGGGEADRRVWVAQSTDNGISFSAETNLSVGETGACSCCGLKIFTTDRGDLYALYRSATDMVHRDIYVVGSNAFGRAIVSTKVGPWEIGACVMSTAAMTGTPAGGVVAAFEQQGNVVTCDIAPGELTPRKPTPMPGSARNRKHPAIAVNGSGQRLVAWAEGTAWARGGSVVWQVFDDKGRPVSGAAGSANDLPVWDAPAAAAMPDGHFLLFY